MLRIEIPSGGFSGLTFNGLEKYDIPSPPNGFTSEVNNIAVMLFEDEQEAIDYAHELDAFSNQIDPESHEYKIITDLIRAVGDDEFVQSYIRS